MNDTNKRQLRSRPYTPLKQALRMKLLCALGIRAGCLWARATTIQQLSAISQYFDYIFSDTDVVPVDPCICLTEEDNNCFSVWESEEAKLQCKSEYGLAPQCVKNLFKDPNALKEYAAEIACFFSIVNRKRIVPIKKALEILQETFPGILLDTFLEISSYLNYLLCPEDDDVLHIFRLKFGREANTLCILAILTRQSSFSSNNKTIDESLADWMECRSDHSVNTLLHIAAVLECPFDKIERIVRASDAESPSL